MAHKMRMDEMKAQVELEKVKAGNVKALTQNNVHINGEVPFGQGNYGELMKKLLKDK